MTTHKYRCYFISSFCLLMSNFNFHSQFWNQFYFYLWDEPLFPNKRIFWQVIFRLDKSSVWFSCFFRWKSLFVQEHILFDKLFLKYSKVIFLCPGKRGWLWVMISVKESVDRIIYSTRVQKYEKDFNINYSKIISFSLKINNFVLGCEPVIKPYEAHN